MRILFCNNFFPGHFEPLAKYLSEKPETGVLFAFSRGRRDFVIPSVRRVLLRNAHERPVKDGDRLVQHWRRAVNEGREAYKSFSLLKNSGYKPELILYSADCGESLFLKELFPNAFRVAYLTQISTDINLEDEQKSCALPMQGFSLLQADAVFAFPGLENAMPAYLRSAMGQMPMTVDTQFFNQTSKPFISEGVNFSQAKKLVSIAINRDESENEIKPLIEALLGREECHVLLTCSSAATRQKMEDVFKELFKKYPARLHVRSLMRRGEYQAMLAASTCRVFPAAHNQPEKLLETMSCGAILLANVNEKITVMRHGETMLAWPKNHQEQISLVNRVLDGGEEINSIKANGRKAVVDNHEQSKLLPLHVNELLKLYDIWQQKIN